MKDSDEDGDGIIFEAHIHQVHVAIRGYGEQGCLITRLFQSWNNKSFQCWNENCGMLEQ